MKKFLETKTQPSDDEMQQLADEEREILNSLILRNSMKDSSITPNLEGIKQILIETPTPDGNDTGEIENENQNQENSDKSEYSDDQEDSCELNNKSKLKIANNNYEFPKILENYGGF